MLVKEYRRLLGITDFDNHIFRYNEKSVPRSRRYYDYVAHHDMIRSYFSLLGALVQTSDLYQDRIVDYGRYYRVGRVNSTSATINQSLYCQGTINFFCAASHAQYAQAIEYVNNTGNMFNESVVGLPTFTMPGVTIYYHRQIMNDFELDNFRIYAIVDNDSFNQNVIELCAKAFMYIVYKEFVDNDMIDPNLGASPENMWGLWSQRDLDFVLPQAIVDNAETIIQQRQAAEEERLRKEEEERQRQIEESRRNIQADNEAALKAITIPDRSAANIKHYCSTIQDNRAYIRDYMQKIEAYKAEIARAEALINAWALQSVADETTVYDQLKDLIGLDKCVRKVTQRDSSALDLYCISPIIYWEEDEVAQWEAARNGAYWDVVRVVCSKRFQYTTGAKITVNFANAHVVGCELPEDSRRLLSDSPFVAKHPHIARYSCFGNNEYTISEEIKCGHFDVALSYINSCMMQINLTDGCVVTTMSEYINNNSALKMFYDTVENKYVTYSEALGILNQEGTN